MFMLLRRVCRRDAYSSSDDDDALGHGTVKANSEGKGNRVLGRLGIPLATSYFIWSSSVPTASKNEWREGGQEGENVPYLCRSRFVETPRDCPSSRLGPMDEFLDSPVFHLRLL